ncbi:glycosyltransferase family 4 protein [Desulfosediminicola sp.]|uniref:glycosyltransferase family 4 protein n=1 Tax=Desulfosediminicola sp. TaxID=2886825 RepID=UPI003AF2C9E4
MKVLYFHQHFVTPMGAGATRSYAMAQKLIQRGHSVTMVCGNFQGGTTGLSGEFFKGFRRGLVDGIDVIELELQYSNSDGFMKRGRTFFSFAIRSARIALGESYDIVFATTTPLTAGIPGIFARWLRRKPFVFEVRDLWPELPKAMGVISNPIILWAMGILEWLSYHSANRLIGLSPGIVSGIRARGIEAERIIMVPNGCDLDIFSADVDPWRPDSILPTDFMAVFAGTHGIANGLDAVLDAAVELKIRERSDIKFLLIGNGKLKQTLQARVQRERLNNVVFHEPVIKNKLAGLMLSTDLGMQILANVPAFYYGTSPNKFFDYIAAGLPVLNNYPGWLADMIISTDCGFSIPPDDPVSFADSLEEAAGDKERLNKMGENGLELARREFDREKLSEQFVDWLESTFCNWLIDRKHGKSTEDFK